MEQKEIYIFADNVFKKYLDFYGPDFIKGINFLVAEEIYNKVGGTIVVGILNVDGEEIPHCWVSTNKIHVIDPIYNYVKRNNKSVYRSDSEPDMKYFKLSVNRYRQYQI